MEIHELVQKSTKMLKRVQKCCDEDLQFNIELPQGGMNEVNPCECKNVIVWYHNLIMEYAKEFLAK